MNERTTMIWLNMV